jgi:hypothetical protein
VFRAIDLDRLAKTLSPPARLQKLLRPVTVGGT